MSFTSTFPPDHATVCTPTVIRCAADSREIAQYPPYPPVSAGPATSFQP